MPSHLTLAPVLTLFLLGAFHGVNPAMGWLFAVALGMQERRAVAVWRALPALALGHVLAVAAAIAAAGLVGVFASPHAMRLTAAVALMALGIRRFFRQHHRHWGGMRVGMWGLTAWSFLMASAHGAGLMVLPFTAGAAATSHHHGAAMAEPVQTSLAGVAAALVHGSGYLLVTAVVAIVVFQKLGLGLLRKAWVNLDLAWAVALALTGGLVLIWS